MDNTEFLKQVDAQLKDKVDKARAEKNTQDLMGLTALIAQDRKESDEEHKGFMAALFQDLKEALLTAIGGIKQEPPQVIVQPTPVTIPEIKVPEVTVNVPEIKVPEARVTVDIPKADVGEAPVKIGGIGITANPTAVAGGQMVTARFDKIGRQLITPYQVRDLIGTAFISLATSAGYNTETTLIAAGAAGVFNDIIEITCTNDSTVAAIFDLRDGTASGVVKRLIIPANATFEKLFLVPLPQNVAGTNAWTVKNSAAGTDTTGTNVTFSSIYAQNV